jgi:adenylate cyclase
MSATHVRRLRLGAALILLTYLILHFSNHALGIISLDAMAAGRWWFLALWRSTLGTVALYGAIVVHGMLALWLLYQRRTLRMPVWEATQYALGLMLPALLVVHVVSTRIAWWRLGADDPYTRIVLALWVLAPEYGARQTLTLVLAWLHACIGVHFWLRFRPWYPRAAPWLFASRSCSRPWRCWTVAAGRGVTAHRTPGWTECVRPRRTGRRRGRRWWRSVRLPDRLPVGAPGGPAGARTAGCRVAACGADHLSVRPRRGRAVGFTILDASRMADIPRLRVRRAWRARPAACGSARPPPLPAASEAERRVLARVGAAPDVRLACQTRPARDVTVGRCWRPQSRQPTPSTPISGRATSRRWPCSSRTCAASRA